MFSMDPGISDLQVKEKILSRVFFSLNSPQIATPELSVEEARCYVLLINDGGVYNAYIGLYLPASDRRFYYPYSGNPIPENKATEAIEDASRFAEEMGFLLDEFRLSSLSVDERNKWIEDQPIFGYKKKEESEKEEPKKAEPAPEEAKAKEKPADEQPQKAEEAPPAPESEDEQPATAQADDMADGIEFEEPEPAPAKKPAKRKAAPPPPPVEEEEEEAEPAAEAVEYEPVEYKPPQPQPRRTPPKKAAPPVEVEEAGEPPQEELAASKPAAKQQKGPARKAIQASTGTVTKEYEALARLLASF